jgi:hypothetical protein
MTEQKLLEEYVKARRESEKLDSELKEAKKRMVEAEEKLISYMEENGITSTAKYADYGRISIIAPMLRVSIEPGKEQEAFDYLRSIGESSAIKEQIHWKTLASIMRSKVEKNESLPSCYSYYFQQQTRYEQQV